MVKKKPAMVTGRRSIPEVAKILGVSKKRLKELIAICGIKNKENKENKENK